MADVSKTVEIIFGGKDQLSPLAGKVGASLDKVGKFADKIATPLAKLADYILMVDAALGTLAIGAIALATKEAGSFSDQIAEISTLTGATSENIAGFKNEILDYARSSKSSIDDINSAIYQAVSLGTDYTRSLDLIADAEKLSVAGRADLTRSTELLAGTLNAYGDATDQATRYSDVFFTTVRLGKTTIPELADSIARVSGLASNAGIPIETLSSAIAALTAAGLPTSEAITGIRAAISNIIDPAQKAREMAESLGLGFSASALHTKGFEGVLKDVYTTTSGNIEKISALFDSTRALNSALTLGADKSGKFAESLKAMQSVTGATDVAYTKMADNFTLANQNLANNLKATLIQVGEPLLDAYGDTASALSGIFKGLSIGIDEGAFDPLFGALTGLGDKVSDFVQGISDVLPEALTGVDFSPITDALSSIGGAISDFFGDLDLTDPEDLAEAMQFAVDSISSLITTTQGFAQQFKPIWDTMFEGIQRFNDTSEEFKLWTGRILGIAKQIKEFGLTVAWAADTLNVFGIKISDVLSFLASAKDRISGVIGIFTNLNMLNFSGVGESWKKAFGSMTEASEKAADSTKKTGEAFEATNKTVGEGGKEAAQKVIDSTNTAAQVAEEFRQIWGEVSRGIADEDLPKVDTGVKELKRSTGELVKYWTDNQGVTHFQEVGGAAEEASKKIEKIPKSVEFELKIQKLDISRYEAQTKRLSEIFDFKAKLNLAEIEAGTKRMEAMFKSVDATIVGTGKSITDLFGIYADIGSHTSQAYALEDQIKEENRRRDEALQLQKKVTEAQIDLLRTKGRAIERGDSIIKVSADGLKPHLEAFMWEILSAVQVRVNEEGAEMLLGLT